MDALAVSVLGTQLHVTHKPRVLTREGVGVVVNEPGFRQKPSGGLWTSSLLGPSHGSGWVQWCLGEEFDGPEWEHCWLIEPDPGARVYVIDSYEDLRALRARCPLEMPDTVLGEQVDWAAASELYDAVNLTDHGQWATRMTHPLNLYGWDCESTLWLRAAFSEPVDDGPRTYLELVEEP